MIVVESEKFPDQILVGGLSTIEITLGLAAVAIVFVAGLMIGRFYLLQGRVAGRARPAASSGVA